MGKYRDLNTGDIFPASWTDALQEFISTMASANFALDVVAAANAVTLVAGANDAQVSVGINGRWRYITATVTSNAITGGTAAGTYAVYATAADNSFAAGDVDNTVYAFALEIRTSGTPSTALWRKVADVAWNGNGITGVISAVGRNNNEVLVGAQLPWTGDGDPADARFLMADGRLVASTTYPMFDAQAGGKAVSGKTHKYNGGVDPGGGMVRLPDKRGKSPVGAANMGTAQGTAAGNGRIQLAAGASTGEVLHTLLAAESGLPAHNPSVSVTIGPQLGNILGDDGNTSPTTFGFTTGAGNLVKRQNQYSVTSASSSVGAANASSGHNTVHPVEADNWVVRVK